MKRRSWRRRSRLSKRFLSSSVGVGGGVLIDVVVVVSSVIPTVVVVGVGVVGLRCSAPSLVVSMFSVAGLLGFFGSSASFGKRSVFGGFTVGFPLSPGHIGRE